MQDYTDAIRSDGDFTLIDIIVTPNARNTGIKGFDPWRKRIMVEVKEPPIQNRANMEILDFFSKLFNAEVKIARGVKDREKTLEATLTEDEAKTALYESK